MKLTFESNLGYQQDAIKSITDLFEGQPLKDSILEFNLYGSYSTPLEA